MQITPFKYTRVLSFSARRLDFVLCLPLKLSDYICSDGTNKWFFIIMHYGIIFSCMENFKDQQWPVFSLIIHEGLLKRSSEGGQDLLP